MLRSTLRVIALTVIIAALVVGSAPALASTSQRSGAVQVSATVNACASVSVISPDQLVVYANEPWRLTCETDHGVVSVSGSRTIGTQIQLPAGTSSYSVSLD